MDASLDMLNMLRSFTVSEMALMSVEPPGEGRKNLKTDRSKRGMARNMGAQPAEDREQVQRFFKSKKFTDDAIRLYRNLATPVYVVPAWEYDFSREKRPIVLRDALQLQYFGVTQKRAAELETARRAGAAILVVTAATLTKGFLPTPWMIVHAMFDAVGHGPLGSIRGRVIDVLERIVDRDPDRYDPYVLERTLAPLLTMKSARTGVLTTRDDFAAEIMTQAVLTTKGFTYVDSDDEKLQDDLREIENAVSDARAQFDRYINGKVIDVDTFMLVL